jgi:general secretion pathway protein A
MYKEFFGFSELPFELSSEPRFFYANRIYQEAFTGVRWGTKLRQGVIVVTGEEGTGKTSLLRMVTGKFESDIHVSLISSHHADFGELLGCMASDFGLTQPENERHTHMRVLRSYLIEQLKRNHIVVAFVDDAHSIEVHTLRKLILLLSETGPDNKRLLQLVLVGSPELEAKFEHPELRPIKCHVAQWCRIGPLQSDEIGAYINHRLVQAGYRAGNLFTPDAVDRIALFSRGIPRLINIICDGALAAAYNSGQRSISSQLIQTVSGRAWLARAAALRGSAASWAGKSEANVHLVEPAQEAANRVPGPREVSTTADNEPQWDFELPVALGGEPGDVRRVNDFAPFRIAGGLLLFILICGAAWLSQPGEQTQSTDTGFVIASRWTNDLPGRETAREVFSQKGIEGTDQPQTVASEGVTALPQAEPLRKKMVPASAMRSKPAQPIGTKVILHSPAERDGSILAEVGEALRISGYVIPDTRFSSSRTRGDVRFFFAQDRPAAERVKTIVESELRRLGYDISLEMLQRDGRNFQFAAPGKIEVWVPRLPKCC